MAINTSKNSYTILFATIMVVVVGTVLAFTASSLRPKIDENRRFEKQQNILYAMGVNQNVDEGSVDFVPANMVEGEFHKYIKEQIVYSDGKVTDDDQAYLIDLKKEMEAIKEGKPARLPVFIGEKDGKTFYILPMYGKGLWDAIWGYMSLNDQLVIQDVYFDHAGETPGLGANIKQRYFMDDFTGEYIMKGDQFVGVSVAKGNNDPLNQDKEDNQVDALAGATITGNGITAMIKETLHLYEPYLKTIRK